MGDLSIDNYISRRYSHWLEYSAYFCNRIGIPDEAQDVLNEVLLYLFSRYGSKRLQNLMQRSATIKKIRCTELDRLVLGVIKRNILSPTSPYQSKYKSLPSDENADYTRIEIEDTIDDDTDPNEEALSRLHQVRDIFESLDLSGQARAVFFFHFFQDRNFSEWDGPEDLSQLYEIYNGVLSLIKKKINGGLIF